MAFKLAACAEMLYLDLPIEERITKISEQGFLVEIWDWASKDLEALARTGASFSSMTGYLRGDLVTEEGRAELLSTAQESIVAAEKINCPRLNLHGTGLGPGGIPVRPVEVVTPDMWLYAADTLRHIAELGAKNNATFVLENLNLAVDHPGTPFARAADTLALVKSVNHPNLRLNLDLYHAQIGEGNLIELLKAAQPYIGEIQVADVPGRMEPGTGEINYQGIARALKQINYDGVIGMEAFASGDSTDALNAFRTAFSASS